MRSRTLGLCLLAAAISGSAVARLPGEAAGKRRFMGATGELQLAGRPVGGAHPAAPTAAYLAGSRIMAAGTGALVIDADSGALIKTNDAGEKLGELAIARDAGLLTYDPMTRRAYVADRMHDRIAVVNADTLAITSSIKTPAEPFGVALTPDRKQLLVSTIADRTLVAYDAATGAEQWRTALGAEPRGLAVSPDGTRAMVAYLTTGTIDQIDLTETRRAEHLALSTEVTTRRCRHCGNDGDSFARGAFAVAFMGEHIAVAPFQREVPVQANQGEEHVGSYGGGSTSPLAHELAFFGFGAGHGGYAEQSVAALRLHQPRALAWDGARDALYVAGMGNDTLLQVRNASQQSITPGVSVNLTVDEEHCGPDGVAITSASKVMVWCSFSRKVALVDFGADSDEHWGEGRAVQAFGKPLVASAMTAKQHQGLELFHLASEQVSSQGNLACASCHPDNRADGLSWRIDKHELQTPLLSGRLVGTHPFKWDGGDPTLRASLHSTMKRLGGSGLSKAQTDSLAAYLEALPAVRTPTQDAVAVARGKQVFETEGCRSCHDGPAYTDRERHKMTGTLKQSDTPSLIGVSASAPY
ncbi:MAG TPA: hypothetical protein VGC42_24325, partial [Kofleriaceae bacterium]